MRSSSRRASRSGSSRWSWWPRTRRSCPRSGRRRRSAASRPPTTSSRWCCARWSHVGVALVLLSWLLAVAARCASPAPGISAGEVNTAASMLPIVFAHGAAGCRGRGDARVPERALRVRRPCADDGRAQRPGGGGHHRRPTSSACKDIHPGRRLRVPGSGAAAQARVHVRHGGACTACASGRRSTSTTSTCAVSGSSASGPLGAPASTRSPVSASS